MDKVEKIINIGFIASTMYTFYRYANSFELHSNDNYGRRINITALVKPTGLLGHV